MAKFFDSRQYIDFLRYKDNEYKKYDGAVNKGIEKINKTTMQNLYAELHKEILQRGGYQSVIGFDPGILGDENKAAQQLDADADKKVEVEYFNDAMSTRPYIYNKTNHDDCGGVCEAQCSHGCGTSCGNSCGKNSCNSQCQNKCETSCGNRCVEECGNGCRVSCGGCGDSCSSGCGYACSNNCSNNCGNNCAVTTTSYSYGYCTDCSSNCSHGCSGSCNGYCISTCSNSCSDNCAGKIAGYMIYDNPGVELKIDDPHQDKYNINSEE